MCWKIDENSACLDSDQERKEAERDRDLAIDRFQRSKLKRDFLVPMDSNNLHSICEMYSLLFGFISLDCHYFQLDCAQFRLSFDDK